MLEDDADYEPTWSIHLEGIGYDVLEARGGDEALSLLKQYTSIACCLLTW